MLCVKTKRSKQKLWPGMANLNREPKYTYRGLKRVSINGFHLFLLIATLHNTWNFYFHFLIYFKKKGEIFPKKKHLHKIRNADEARNLSFKRDN